MFKESRNDRRRLIGTRAIAYRLRDRDNSAEIGDNSAEIGDGDRRYRRERDPMLNSVPNGDWSNSVPGRKIPEGITWNSECAIVEEALTSDEYISVFLISILNIYIYIYENLIFTSQSA